MKPFIQMSILCSALLLAGCNSRIKQDLGIAQENPPVIIQASGRAMLKSNTTQSAKQVRFDAEQEAKMMAYRALFAQVVEENIPGEKFKVGEQVVTHENYRIYLDTALRNAVVTDIKTIGRHLSVLVQLDLTPAFFHCMSGGAEVISRCLQQQNKLSFSRIGYQTAEHRTVNMNCLQSDCANLMHTGGFSRRINPIDQALLRVGLTDLEWKANMAGRLFINYKIINSTP